MRKAAGSKAVPRGKAPPQAGSAKAAADEQLPRIPRTEQQLALAPAQTSSAPPQQRIKGLDQATIHEICTNQIIVSLESCVKELVENALDAGAAKIELTLIEGGVDGIYLTDDGRGIAEADLEHLCKRHWTSKLREFEDLHGDLATYGFRGEALSAICALSGRFEVVSKRDRQENCGGDLFVRDGEQAAAGKSGATGGSKKKSGKATAVNREEVRSTSTALVATNHLAAGAYDSRFGCKVEYDRGGNLVKKERVVLPSAGTTVKIEKLFSTTPVRREDFKKHAKNQLAETVRLLSQFAVCQYQVKFSVKNEKRSSRGGVDVVSLLATPGAFPSLKAAAISVHGGGAGGFLDKTVEVDLVGGAVPTSAAKGAASGKANENENGNGQQEITWRLTGVISQANAGRSNRNLQQFFINFRPAEWPKKIQKTVNESFKAFNSRQFPVAILNFQAGNEDVDVNVTPDKRTIHLLHEAAVASELGAWMAKAIPSTNITGGFGGVGGGAAAGGGGRRRNFGAAAIEDDADNYMAAAARAVLDRGGEIEEEKPAAIEDAAAGVEDAFVQKAADRVDEKAKDSSVAVAGDDETAKEPVAAAAREEKPTSEVVDLDAVPEDGEDGKQQEAMSQEAKTPAVPSIPKKIPMKIQLKPEKPAGRKASGTVAAVAEEPNPNFEKFFTVEPATGGLPGGVAPSSSSSSKRTNVDAGPDETFDDAKCDGTASGPPNKKQKTGQHGTADADGALASGMSAIDIILQQEEEERQQKTRKAAAAAASCSSFSSSKRGTRKKSADANHEDDESVNEAEVSVRPRSAKAKATLEAIKEGIGSKMKKKKATAAKAKSKKKLQLEAGDEDFASSEEAGDDDAEESDGVESSGEQGGNEEKRNDAALKKNDGEIIIDDESSDSSVIIKEEVVELDPGAFEEGEMIEVDGKNEAIVEPADVVVDGGFVVTDLAAMLASADTGPREITSPSSTGGVRKMNNAGEESGGFVVRDLAAILAEEQPAEPPAAADDAEREEQAGNGASSPVTFVLRDLTSSLMNKTDVGASTSSALPGASTSTPAGKEDDLLDDNGCPEETAAPPAGKKRKKAQRKEPEEDYKIIDVLSMLNRGPATPVRNETATPVRHSEKRGAGPPRRLSGEREAGLAEKLLSPKREVQQQEQSGQGDGSVQDRSFQCWSDNPTVPEKRDRVGQVQLDLNGFVEKMKLRTAASSSPSSQKKPYRTFERPVFTLSTRRGTDGFKKPVLASSRTIAKANSNGSYAPDDFHNNQFSNTQVSCWAPGVAFDHDQEEFNLTPGATPAQDEDYYVARNVAQKSEDASPGGNEMGTTNQGDENPDKPYSMNMDLFSMEKAGRQTEGDFADAGARFDQRNFKDIKVHGQFNAGFILGSWKKELFIFDQHACDEKKRFEYLNRTSKVEQQMLLNPLLLELAPSQELTVSDYLHVFRKNGFEIKYDNSRPPGQRCFAVALPSTKGFVFGVSDIDDLINVIEEEGTNLKNDDTVMREADARSRQALENGGVQAFDPITNNDRDLFCEEAAPMDEDGFGAPAAAASSSSASSRPEQNQKSTSTSAGSSGGAQQGEPLLNIQSHRSCWGATSDIPRPKKIWTLLASRACRSAIMIGKKLTVKEMEKIVFHLSEMDQPWNCPHGRPTLRHLTNTENICCFFDALAEAAGEED